MVTLLLVVLGQTPTVVDGTGVDVGGVTYVIVSEPGRRSWLIINAGKTVVILRPPAKIDPPVPPDPVPPPDPTPPNPPPTPPPNPFPKTLADLVETWALGMPADDRRKAGALADQFEVVADHIATKQVSSVVELLGTEGVEGYQYRASKLALGDDLPKWRRFFLRLSLHVEQLPYWKDEDWREKAYATWMEIAAGLRRVAQ